MCSDRCKKQERGKERMNDQQISSMDQSTGLARLELASHTVPKSDFRGRHDNFFFISITIDLTYAS